MGGRTGRRRGVGIAASLVVMMGAVACTPDGETPPEQKESTPGPAVLTFAAYGPPALISAYTAIAAEYTAENPEVVINVRPYDTEDAAVAANLKAIDDGRAPDLFLMPRTQLPALLERKATRRVDDLLGERQIEFGDGFQRDALEAFSAASALQCMPIDSSPLVVYVNTELIDLDKVGAEGEEGEPVDAEAGWTLDQFAQAAAQARARGVRGAYVAPNLDQVAPFVWSGGGELVDDQEAPTSLSLAEESSSAALVQLLEVVRNPRLTFGQRGLRARAPLARFKGGSLGMILGYRDLVPELRAQQGLQFDVMPLPRISTRATTATMTGACLAADSGKEAAAADFLAHLISDDSAGRLAQTGYVVPTNLKVLADEAFLQPRMYPVSSSTFVTGLRGARLFPDVAAWAQVRTSVDQELGRLFTQPVIDPPLEDRLAALDEASRGQFDPASLETPGATPSPATTVPEPSPTN